MSGDWEELTAQTERMVRETWPSQNPLVTANLFLAIQYGILTRGDVVKILRERNARRTGEIA